MDKQKIKIISIVIGVALLLFLVSLLVGGYQVNQERKEKVAESIVEMESLAKKVEEDSNDYMLTNEFVMNHLPYEIESSKVYNHSHTAEKPKMEKSELQQTVIAQLYTAIKKRDINGLLATFKVESYLSYLNEFSTQEDMLKEFEEVFDRMLKNESLQSIGLIDEGENTFSIYFIYTENREIIVPVTMALVEDIHSRADYYLISTPIQDFLSNFK